MEEKYLKNVVTSGEAAMQALNENKFGKLFYHLGPLRDESIFYKVKENKTKLENSEFILCTGLFDEHENEESHQCITCHLSSNSSLPDIDSNLILKN